MKKFRILFLLVFAGCIGEDVILDEIDPVVRITNPIASMEVNTSYQFEYMFLDNVGAEATPTTLTWQSSDESLLTIDNTGMAQAIGNGTVSVSVSASLNELQADTLITFEITGDPTMMVEMQRAGSIETTSSYVLRGDFTLSQDGENLRLEFDDTYEADDGLPGLYVYLTNNPNTVSGAYEIGRVSIFSGSHDYVLSNVELFDYQYVLYYCKPFNVKVGDGTIQ